MKRLTAAILLLLVFACPACAIPPNTTLHEGFRGIEWGDPVEKLGASILTESDGIVNGYQKIGDYLYIGDTKLDHISYFFHKNKFICVYIVAYGYIDSGQRLKDVLIAVLGAPTGKAEQSGITYWTDDKLLVTFRYDSVTELTTVIIGESEGLAEVEKEKARRAHKAISDL